MQDNNILAWPFKKSFISLIKNYPYILISAILHIIIRMLCFVPCIINASLKCLLISIVLYAIVVAYLRPSFASSMEAASRGEKFNIKNSFISKSFIENIRFSFNQLAKIVVWGVPLLAYIGTFYYFYSGGTDFKTLALFIRNLGEKFFGKEAGIAEGSALLIFAFLIMLIILYLGVSRQSSIRYLRMSPIYYSAVPSAEIRRCLAGKRLNQLLIFLFNTILLLPILYIVFKYLSDAYMSTENILNFIPTIIRKRFYFSMLGSMGIWYLLVYPIRKSLSAAFASNCRYKRENERNKIR